MRYIGIDPGLDGAIACVDDGLSVVCCDDLPTLTRTVGRKKQRIINATLLAMKVDALWECADKVSCEVSQVTRRVGNGRTPGASSVFSTGRTYGMIEGIMAALRIPVMWVPPATWKKRLGLTGKGKDDSIAQAVHLMPQSAPWLTRKRDHGRAEALLIAYYAMRMEDTHAASAGASPIQ